MTSETPVGATEIRTVLAQDTLANLDKLDRPSLLFHLENLTSELRERAKWEALRQHDCWRRAEVEAWGKYGALLKEQRHEISRRHESEVISIYHLLHRCILYASLRVDSSHEAYMFQQLAAARTTGEVRLAEAIGAAESAILAEDETALAQEVARLKEYYQHVLDEKKVRLASACRS